MKINYFIFVFFFLLFLSSCSYHLSLDTKKMNLDFTNIDSESITKTIDVDMFRYLEVDINANIDLIQSDSLIVIINGNKHLLSQLDIIVSNSKMKIQFKKSILQNNELNLKVYVPNLQYILMNGSGKININNWSNEDRLTLKNNGAATFSLYGLRKIKHLNIELHGDGNFISTGESDKVNQVKCVLNGSGNIDFETINSIDSEIEINGSGNVTLGEIEYLNAYINGSGNIIYKGFPKIHQKNIGSGTLIQK